MIKYVIIDDEPIAHDIIKGYCDILPSMELQKNCYDAIEALEFLRNTTVDLIFLDINMPKLKGFDFLRSLSNPPKIIVTTAYKEYALEGYELEIVDYLLKPFGFDRFLKAINKAFKGPETSTGEISIASGDPDAEEYTFLYSDKKHTQVKVDTILFIEAAGNYCKVVMPDRSLLVRAKISEMLEKFSSHQFIQVHKSYIVSKKSIKTIEGNRIEISDYTIPIGKAYKSNIQGIIDEE